MTRIEEETKLTQSKLCHSVAKYANNASRAIWWPKLQLMQVVSTSGKVYYYCKWRHVVAKFSPSHGVNFWVRCASGNVFYSDKCDLTQTLLRHLVKKMATGASDLHRST